MANAKSKIETKYLPYPEPVTSRSGCKVSWNYYVTEDDANACSKAAIHNAKLDRAQGYDFGYCAPGQVVKMASDARYRELGKVLEVGGLYEVCLP